MSQETVEWLNQNTLIGFAEKRDQWAAAGGWVRTNEEGLIVPWHAQEGYENAYRGPVPVEAVLNKLFAWEAESRETYIKVPTDNITEANGVGEDGLPYKMVRLEGFQTIVRNDTETPFEVFRGGYQIHSYKKWLLDNIANILDDELGIESALLLKNGGVACVSVCLPDAVMSDAEYPLLVKLMGYTSHNGQHSTGYLKVKHSPVCDNSMNVLVNAGERDGQRIIKYKHSKNSVFKINDARDALSILYQTAEQDIEFFDLLARWEVNNAEMRQVVRKVMPVPEAKVEDGRVTNQRAITIAENKQAEIAMTYKRDPRVVKWDGTALGVVQAFNTWEQQVRGGLKTNRVERNTLNAMSDVDAEFDAIVMASLTDVTGWAVEKQDSGLQLVKVG